MEVSFLAPQKGKRKHDGNGELTTKRKKVKNKRQSVFSYETEELLLTCNDALEDGKQAISQIYTKLQSVSCREEQSKTFLETLKMKISHLTEYSPKDKIYIGLFGKTGAGKSSLINAIVNENQLLPSGSMQACTSAFVHVQANTDSKKYKADIEFISTEEWKSELQYLVELLKNEKDPENMAAENTEDDEMVQTAKEKIRAIYGEEGLKNYRELVGAKEFPEILATGRKTMDFDTAKELSQSIGCYIRSDKRTGEQQFWPLVKRVTISLPKSPALLEGIVLVDLPGAGDVSKHRSEMWKECLSQCSSVWIVNEINRALSEKVANEIFDKSLRTVAGGGECHNVTFIATKTDVINPEEIRENYHLTDEDLDIESNIVDPERREKQACILFRNERLKEDISALLKEKTKNFLLGGEEHSDGFFDVFTVSSEQFKRIAQNKSNVLELNETELPYLEEHIKKLYVSHSVKEMKDYISDVSGIISHLHFSKDALSSKVQSSHSQEFNRLKKELNNMCTTLNKALSKVYTDLQACLLMGSRAAEKACLRNATKSVLEPTWCDNRGYHQTLKALCRNDGYYRSGKVGVVDLNYTLSEPMYRKMNEKNLFLTTFGAGCSRASIKGIFSSFLEDFISKDLLKYHMKNNTEKYLRLVYIRTEQRKLHKKLEKEILKRKKQIYNSLSDSIRDTMKQTYQECSEIKGAHALKRIKETLTNTVVNSKSSMFEKAMNKMLEEFSNLQELIVEEMETQMTTSLKLALNQIPDDLTDLPDVTEEIEMMKRCCDTLDLQVF
ncbi:hypothetical protein SKAU_G00420450 [Synaphobranchus kaupii]|uniref:Nuclear GTPase SLIP-GC n=1 Tax=Synaphobranchus kaupii TaxID=118154 RepID=A0A9Q1IB47_SYNKA|nr:hypothetical protein SKAU_G00420450 [Synaphobranchus kaupii]